MTAGHLIEVLQSVDKDAEVRVFWDGVDRGEVDGVFIHSGDGVTERGTVVIVGDWCIYKSRVAAQHKIIFAA